MSKTEENKAVVEKLFNEFFVIPMKADRNLSLIDELVHEDYVQHNPMAGQGREGLRTFLTTLFLEIATKRDNLGVKTLKVVLIAEGDYVVRQELRTNGMLVDIFRVANGQLIEHWDAFRAAPGEEQPFGF